MGLFDLFKKRDGAGPEAPAAAPAQDDLEEHVYPGMRVEVTTLDGRLLFVAKLSGVRAGRGELVQYTDSPASQGTEPLRVKIRGYNEHRRKAVHMEAAIAPLPKHIWQVEGLELLEVTNSRAFFRLDTDLEAAAIILTGPNAGEQPCRLLNISVGGARIWTERRYQEGDKFLLRVRLLEDRDDSTIFCQILRTFQREDGTSEYGCRFLELNEADEMKIVQSIHAIQRKSRSRV